MENVIFLERRFAIVRKGWAQIASTLALLEEALRHPAEFDHYSMLSGHDYPIKPPAVIGAALARADTDYINYWRLSERPEWLPMVERYHYRDEAAWQETLPPLKRSVARALARAKHLAHRVMLEMQGKRRPPEGLIPFGGSSWWSLSDRSIRWIVEYVRTHRSVLRFFKHTDSPCELFFQTILLNSEHARRCALHDRYDDLTSSPGERERMPESEFNLRYIDWSPTRWTSHDGQGTTRGPAVLDERDFDALAISTALFARKTHPLASRALLERIDRELLKL
jgi:hypothetical protein